MSSNDESKTQALERLSTWKDKGATLLFTFTQPQSRFAITVWVKGVHDESIAFEWLFRPTDSQGTFITTNSFFFTVWLKAASLSVSDDPEPSVTISHGEFRVVLTVLRPTAFGTD
jgi:hypothetical protein